MARTCPNCGKDIARSIKNKTTRQRLIGGWTCEYCGYEVNSLGFVSNYGTIPPEPQPVVPLPLLNSGSRDTNTILSNVAGYLENHRRRYPIADLQAHLVKQGISQSIVDHAVQQICWISAEATEIQIASSLDIGVSCQAQLLGGARPKIFGGGYIDMWYPYAAFTVCAEVTPVMTLEYNRTSKGTASYTILIEGELQYVGPEHRGLMEDNDKKYSINNQDKLRLRESIELTLYYIGNHGWDMTAAFSSLDSNNLDISFKCYKQSDGDYSVPVYYPVKLGEHRQDVLRAKVPRKGNA